MGDMAENYEWPSMPITEWNSGSYQEVAWYVDANHAGGYSYRLCKIQEEGIGGLTEECFQQTPLDFVGDEQWVEYNKGPSISDVPKIFRLYDMPPPLVPIWC